MASRLWLWVFLALGLPSVAQATAALRLSPEELVDRAGLVGEGEVLSVRGEWTADQKRIVSRVRLRVDEAWKGKAGEVEVVVPGGEVGELGQIVQGMPVFREGERVVVFLDPAEPGIEHQVVGLSQGKFSVAELGEAGKFLLPSLEGLKLVDPRTGQDALPLWEAPVPIEELRRQLFPGEAK